MATINSIHSKSIPNGTRFVAIYADGSGAGLFRIGDDGHLYNSDNEHIDSAPDYWLYAAGYGFWMELPKGFNFWGERK